MSAIYLFVGQNHNSICRLPILYYILKNIMVHFNVYCSSMKHSVLFHWNGVRPLVLSQYHSQMLLWLLYILQKSPKPNDLIALLRRQLGILILLKNQESDSYFLASWYNSRSKKNKNNPMSIFYHPINVLNQSTSRIFQNHFSYMPVGFMRIMQYAYMIIDFWTGSSEIQ